MIKMVDVKLLTAYRSTSDKVYTLSETMSEMQGKQKMEGGLIEMAAFTSHFKQSFCIPPYYTEFQKGGGRFTMCELLLWSVQISFIVSYYKSSLNFKMHLKVKFFYFCKLH